MNKARGGKDFAPANFRFLKACGVQASYTVSDGIAPGIDAYRFERWNPEVEASSPGALL